MNITRMACLGAFSLVAACGTTNPLDGSSSGTDPEGGAGAGSNLTFNEGSALYTLQRVRVDGTNLIVEGLPFDGDDSYVASGLVLNQDTGKPLAVVYRRDPALIDDSYTGDSDGPIAQDSYIAIFNENDAGNARTAVARSGSYLEHGFGGYVVGRDSGVTLPTVGQANYTGNYVALRTFNGGTGIELVDGDMTMEVDFEKLEDNGAVMTNVTNRRFYDANGSYMGDLPNLIGTVTANAIEDTGQFETTIRTEYYGPDATTAAEKQSDYGDVKGLFVGSSAEGVVGVIDITMDSYHAPNGTVTIGGSPVTAYGFGDDTTITNTRETGTFVLER